MKILITGVGGNIGYFLTKFFISKKIPVIGIDIIKNELLEEGQYYTFHSTDVVNSEAVNEVFSRVKPTHVIHLAFLMKPLHNLEREYLIDVTGSKNVIGAAVMTKSVKQFVQFSSTSAYGGRPDNKLWIKETQPLSPGDYRYGKHKEEVEEYIAGLKKRKGLNFVVVRMCTCVGPSEYKKGGLVELIYKAPVLFNYGGRETEIQLLHERDLQEILYKIIRNTKMNGTFNLAPDDHCTVRDLVPDKKFLNLPLGPVKALFGLLWALRLTDIYPPAVQLSAYGIVADPAKLKKALNYKFRFGTKAAFLDAVRGMKERQVL